jgi:hypothetical protein
VVGTNVAANRDLFVLRRELISALEIGEPLDGSCPERMDASTAYSVSETSPVNEAAAARVPPRRMQPRHIENKRNRTE